MTAGNLYSARQIFEYVKAKYSTKDGVPPPHIVDRRMLSCFGVGTVAQCEFLKTVETVTGKEIPICTKCGCGTRKNQRDANRTYYYLWCPIGAPGFGKWWTLPEESAE